jgi:hypothetical protein
MLRYYIKEYPQIQYHQSIIYINMEKESFALFVDNSGSVGGCQSYWQTVADILVQYAKDITHYYLWGSYCKISSKK